jgi:hypothetical protein
MPRARADVRAGTAEQQGENAKGKVMYTIRVLKWAVTVVAAVICLAVLPPLAIAQPAG